MDAVAIDAMRLRASFEQQPQTAWTTGAGPQLPVYLGDVRRTDQRDLEPDRARVLDESADAHRVGAPHGRGSAVPVEDDRLEASPERR